MLRSARTLAPPAVALSLLLAGCGGGGDDEKTVAADAPGTSVAAPATDAKAVRAQRSAPGGVVERYIAAFTKGDGTAVCKLYTASYRAKVAKSSKEDSCAKGIDIAFQSGGGDDQFQQSLNGLKVASVSEQGDGALVTLVSTGGAGGATKTGLTMRLRKERGAWRVAQPDTK